MQMLTTKRKLIFFVDFSYATNHFRIECNTKRQAIECECEEGRNCNEKQENLGQKYQKINRAKQNVLCTTTPPIHYAFFPNFSWLLCIQYTINEIAVYLFVAHRCYFAGWNFFLVVFCFWQHKASSIFIWEIQQMNNECIICVRKNNTQMKMNITWNTIIRVNENFPNVYPCFFFCESIFWFANKNSLFRIRIDMKNN